MTTERKKHYKVLKAKQKSTAKTRPVGFCTKTSYALYFSTDCDKVFGNSRAMWQCVRACKCKRAGVCLYRIKSKKSPQK